MGLIRLLSRGDNKFMTRATNGINIGHPSLRTISPFSRRLSFFASALLIAALTRCESPPDPNRDLGGATAIHTLAAANDLTGARKLLEEGATPNVTDMDGVTPLHRAARDGDIPMAQLLLDFHADANMVTKDGWDAVHLAAWREHAEMVKLLLRYGASGNRKTPQGWSVVHMAAIKGNAEVLDAILLDWPVYGEHGKPSFIGDQKHA
jgi:ankyrin repeat protein